MMLAAFGETLFYLGSAFVVLIGVGAVAFALMLYRKVDQGQALVRN